VAADPGGAARGVVEGWARRFDRLLVHVDVDVLDFLDLPVAEETRRNRGLRFAQLVAALRILTTAPNWVALTICEVNPDHAELDGSSLRTLNDGLADALSEAISLGAEPNS
jgi:arginase